MLTRPRLSMAQLQIQRLCRAALIGGTPRRSADSVLRISKQVDASATCFWARPPSCKRALLQSCHAALHMTLRHRFLVGHALRRTRGFMVSEHRLRRTNDKHRCCGQRTTNAPRSAYHVPRSCNLPITCRSAPHLLQFVPSTLRVETR